MVRVKFDDCPYNCSNGEVADYETRRMIPCPHCSERRKELAKEGLAENEKGDIKPLHRLLGVDNKYLEAKFVYDSVIPEGERLFLDDESLKRQESVLEDIYLGLTVGQLPEKSYCIGIGIKGRIDRLVYPFLAKAYLSGLTVAKFISCSDYNRLCMNMDTEAFDYLEKDFVMILIQDGATKADILSAKGLMQRRALNGKITVFITTWVIEACSVLLGNYGDDSKFLACGVFVEYKRSKNGKKSAYINQLTGVENEVYVEEKTNPNMVSMADLLK